MVRTAAGMPRMRCVRQDDVVNQRGDLRVLWPTPGCWLDCLNGAVRLETMRC